MIKYFVKTNTQFQTAYLEIETESAPKLRATDSAVLEYDDGIMGS